jgi:hypothetical protein
MMCPTCGARMEYAEAHRLWHEAEQNRADLLHAHVENLIERVYALEGGDAAWTHPEDELRGASPQDADPYPDPLEVGPWEEA